MRRHNKATVAGATYSHASNQGNHMKVKEMIAKLQKLDPELTLLVLCEDRDVLEKGQGIRIFEPDSTNTFFAKMSRDSNHKARLEITAAGEGQKLASINVTTDF
jgi:polysaccharide pyruvyl transferase WcaK-like protein